MNLKDFFPQVRWPIPKIEDIDKLISQLQNLKDYFVDDSKILKYNTFMYGQMKWPMTVGSTLSVTAKNTAKLLWNIVEGNNPQE